MTGDGSYKKISRPLISDWQDVSHVPALVAGELHVWLVRVDERLHSLLETSLSRPERERAAAFKFRSHQSQFVVSRGALRFLLGQYVGEPAGSVEILSAELGKPYLSRRFLPNVQFNVSHSGEYALLAFTLGLELGIDIERHDPGAIDEGLLKQCLTVGEKLRFEQALTERTQFFFDLWTRKEAYMKLLGDGLNIPPNELSLAPIRSGRQAINGDHIYFTAMPDIEGFSSALATGKQPTEVQFYTLGSNLLT